MNFENSIKELEKIVNALDSGELSLEESLELYKKGLEITDKCNKQIEDAKLLVEEFKK